MFTLGRKKIKESMRKNKIKLQQKLYEGGQKSVILKLLVIHVNMCVCI